MNPYDRLLFWLFKKSKGIKLGTSAQGLPNIRDSEMSPGKANKWDMNWEVAELYYEMDEYH